VSCAWFRFASLMPHRGRFSLYHSDWCSFKPKTCQSPEAVKGHCVSLYYNTCKGQRELGTNLALSGHSLVEFAVHFCYTDSVLESIVAECGLR